MKYIWIGKKCFLSRNPEDKKDTAFVKEGGIIPFELSKERVAELLKLKQIEKVNELTPEQIAENEFIENQKKLEKLEGELEKAKTALDELPADVTDKKKSGAEKKISNIEEKIEKLENLILEYDGAE